MAFTSPAMNRVFLLLVTALFAATTVDGPMKYRAETETEKWLSELDDESTVTGTTSNQLLLSITSEDEREAARQIGIRGGQLFVRRGKVYKALLFYEELVDKKRWIHEDVYRPKRQTDGDLKIVTRLPNLEVIHLLANRFTDDGLRHFASLKRLRKLVFDNRFADDERSRTELRGIRGEGLRFLKDLLHLQLLVLTRSQVDDSGLSALAELKSLRSLDIQMTPVTERGFEHLGKLTQLEELFLGENQITDRAISNLTNLRMLHKLSIVEDTNRSVITDEALRDVATLPKLESLRIVGLQKVTDAGIAHLAGISNLRSLAVIRTSATARSIESIVEIGSLERLECAGMAIDDARIQKIAERLPRLRSLDLGNARLTDRGASALGEMPNLTDLSVYGSWISDVGMGYLAKIKNLSRLRIEGIGISNAAAAQLAEKHDLIELSIQGAHLTDRGLASLSALHNLEILVIENAAITDASIKEIKKLKRLRELTLSGTSISESGENSIREAVPRTILTRAAVQGAQR